MMGAMAIRLHSRTLAETARQIRMDIGMTQAGFAAYAGVSQATISRLEQGAALGVSSRRVVAAAMGISLRRFNELASRGNTTMGDPRKGCVR